MCMLLNYRFGYFYLTGIISEQQYLIYFIHNTSSNHVWSKSTLHEWVVSHSCVLRTSKMSASDTLKVNWLVVQLLWEKIPLSRRSYSLKYFYKWVSPVRCDLLSSGFMSSRSTRTNNGELNEDLPKVHIYHYIFSESTLWCAVNIVLYFSSLHISMKLRST